MIVGDTRSDEARQALRARAQASTYFMASVIGMLDLSPGLHGRMCDWIANGTRRKLGMVPRDHLKTSCWTIADSVRRIAKNPNIRILLANETATNASHFLRRIEAVFERSPMFQWLFPELIPDFTRVKKWSEVEMLVPRDQDHTESTVETIGVGGAVVSRHYNLLKLDDLVGKEAAESPEVMRKTIDWYLYTESLLNDPKDEIQVVGTRWAFSDLYAHMLENEGENLDTFMLGAYGDVGLLTGDPIWPDRFPGDELERIRKKIGSFRFACQYLNNPHDAESSGFRESWLRWWTWHDGKILPESGTAIRLEDTRRFLRVDPAISEKEGAARSAIIVDAVARDERKFLLEAWAKRCQPFDMIDQIFTFAEQYDVESVGIESVAYQRILKPILERESERRGRWLNVIPMMPDSHERKTNRIRGAFQPVLERGEYWVRKDQEDWLDEYRVFPRGKTVDLIDCTAYGPWMWSAPLEEVDEQDEAEETMGLPGRSPVTGY